MGLNGAQRASNGAVTAPSGAQIVDQRGPNGAQRGPTGLERDHNGAKRGPTGPNGPEPRPERDWCLLAGSPQGPRRPMGSFGSPSVSGNPSRSPECPPAGRCGRPPPRRSPAVWCQHDRSGLAARGNASRPLAPPHQGLGTNLCSTCRVCRRSLPGGRDPAPPWSERARPGPRLKGIGLPSLFCVTKFGVMPILFSPFRGTG